MTRRIMLLFGRRMIWPENRGPLFGIMRDRLFMSPSCGFAQAINGVHEPARGRKRRSRAVNRACRLMRDAGRWRAPA
jgi:hypothetical protein